MEQNLLEVKNLRVHYVTDTGDVQAVNGVDLHLKKGEVLGLVGETGAGKTTVALSVMQLVPDPPGIILDGEILFKGRNLIYNSDRENQEMRGNGISMIFQDPMTALNPIMTIGQQLAEVVIKHKKLSKKAAMEVAAEMLERVGVTRDRINDYPHQFSGGMKQRAIIAMALLCNPEILIADEPTTALDVTIQAQVLEVIRSLIRENEMSMILITHDLGVVAEPVTRLPSCTQARWSNTAPFGMFIRIPSTPTRAVSLIRSRKWTSMTSGCLRSRVWRRTPPHFPAAATSIQDASTARSAAVNRAPQ